MKPVADLDEALNQAVVAHFTHLFMVLVADVTNPEQALERFKNGLRHLAETEHNVAELIREGDQK